MNTTRVTSGPGMTTARGVALALLWWLPAIATSGVATVERVDRSSLAPQPQGGARSAAAQWRRTQATHAPYLAPQGTLNWRGVVRPWQLRQGQRIVEGDISVGPPVPPDEIEPEGLGLANSIGLWPLVGGVVQISYAVTQGNAELPNAIARYNTEFTGVIQWVARTTEADYVDFELDPNDHSGGGFSALGRAGGRQVIGGSIDCNLPTLLHEMGHATGLWHEHSRAEREAHLSLSLQHVIGSAAPNLDVVPLIGGGQSLGLYDIASLMHYGAFTFTKDGEPTLESIPPGMSIAELGDYSAGDIDAILRLYQHAPSAVTVTSNPPGLQVIVDGVARTTPYTFSPALDSIHTLNVPAGPQTLNSRNYIYGRWNDNRAASHSITIGRGNGLTGSPVNKPAVTVYQASFVELLKYEPFVWPDSSGSVVATPVAQAYPPLAGVYYVKRQPVQVQANAQAGYSLYRLYTSEGGVSQNPKTTRSPDWVLAYFTPQQVTTIGTQPAGRWLWVDGGFWVGPVNFSPYYDSGWGAGTIHQVDVGGAPQQPWSWSIRYPWAGWSDAGAAAHNITVPAGSSSVSASFGAEYNVWGWAQQPCAGSVTVSPPSGDGFYAAGANVSVSQSTVAGWTFTGWQRDLAGAGTQSPTPLTMNDEHIVVADYNTTGVPISVAKLAPASRVAGQPKFTLAITGQGFTAGTRAFVNGLYRAPKSATATQLKLAIKPADTATAGTTALFIDNLPAGNWSCSAYAIAELPVRSASAQPLAAVSPASLTFAKLAVGGTSPPQTVTLTNGGNKTLALHDAVVSGGQAGDFLVSASTCGSSLAAAASCTLDLQFHPLAVGKRTSRLLVIDTALDSPQAVGLTGTGK